MSITPLKFDIRTLLKPLRSAMYFLILISICFTSMPIFALANTKVYDYANLLTLEQIEFLEKSAIKITEAYRMDIGIVTINNANGKSSEAYADDFYDNNGYGYTSNYDGLLFLIDLDNRNIYISTCGKAIQYFTDSRINDMLDELIDDVADGNYYDSCTSFLKLTEAYIKTGIPSNQYSVEGTFVNEHHEPFTSSGGHPIDTSSFMLSIIVALLASTFIAFITRILVKRTYTHPRYTVPQTKADDLTVHYTAFEDTFVHTHTSRVRIQSNSSSGGRSSTHHSSGGRSHGGGGRGF